MNGMNGFEVAVYSFAGCFAFWLFTGCILAGLIGYEQKCYGTKIIDATAEDE